MSKPLNKRYRVVVSEQDIEDGKRNSGNFCPLALAVHRAVGRGHVGLRTVHIDQKGQMRIDGQLFRFDDEYQKKRARIFVSMFDARMLVTPWSGTIERREIRNEESQSE